MAYKGKYKVKDPKKYVGDHTKVVYRSLWERQTFRWLEDNPEVAKWNSEDIVVPYLCATDGKKHRYFIDLYVEMKNGDKYLIEIKPKKETQVPAKGKKKTKRYISEQLTYAKNMSKWNAAQQFAKDNGIKFQVWTEDTLRGLGIKVL